MNYHDIKELELKTTKLYSDSKLSAYIFLHKFLLFFTTDVFFWTFSMCALLIVPYFINNTFTSYMITIVFHFFSWEFYLKNYAHKLVSKEKYELDLTIEVLNDIKKERNK